jgi:hypothetical protein
MSISAAIVQPGYPGIEGLVDARVIERKDFCIPLHVGTVKHMLGVFERLGISVPPLGYPACLNGFYRRAVNRHFIDSPKIFVKPYWCKSFDPYVKTPEEIEPPSARRWVQEYVEFDQEYRVYCIGSEIISIARYDPNESNDLDEKSIRQFCYTVIREWTSRPAAYAIDVGWIKGRGLAIVELTDAWAIGRYKPMTMPDYTRMLQVRWDELMSIRFGTL